MGVYEPPPARLAPYAAAFVRWAFEAFELRWFTSHTKKEAAPGYGCDYYARLAGVDPDLIPNLRYIDENRSYPDKWTRLPSGFFILVDDEAVGEKAGLARGKGGLCFPTDRMIGVSRDLALQISEALRERGVEVSSPPSPPPG